MRNIALATVNEALTNNVFTIEPPPLSSTERNKLNVLYDFDLFGIFCRAHVINSDSSDAQELYVEVAIQPEHEDWDLFASALFSFWIWRLPETSSQPADIQLCTPRLNISHKFIAIKDRLISDSILPNGYIPELINW